MPLVAVYLLDSRLEPRNGRQLWFAAIAVVMTIIMAILRGGLDSVPLSLALVVVCASGALLFALVITRSRQITSLDDANSKQLRAQRVQIAQGVALLTGILLLVVQGETGFIALLPLWAGMLGTGLYRLVAVR